MNKFYLVMLIISFLYGCSSIPSQIPSHENEFDNTYSQDPSPTEVFQTISNPKPRVAQPCSTKEVGKAAAEMLKREGYLSDDDCR